MGGVSPFCNDLMPLGIAEKWDEVDGDVQSAFPSFDYLLTFFGMPDFCGLAYRESNWFVWYGRWCSGQLTKDLMCI